MKLSSSLTTREYLIAMRMRMSGHFDWNERFTGFFLGSCFHVTHHAGYEWDRRYASPKNAAVGYIKETENGCEVRYFLARGLLCPTQFISYFLTFTLILIAMMAFHDLLSVASIPVCIGIGFVGTLVPAFISAAFEGLSERSFEGRQALLALLENPEDLFLYLR